MYTGVDCSCLVDSLGWGNSPFRFPVMRTVGYSPTAAVVDEGTTGNYGAGLARYLTDRCRGGGSEPCKPSAAPPAGHRHRRPRLAVRMAHRSVKSGKRSRSHKNAHGGHASATKGGHQPVHSLDCYRYQVRHQLGGLAPKARSNLRRFPAYQPTPPSDTPKRRWRVHLARIP